MCDIIKCMENLKKRYYDFDIARVIAIFTLAFVHIVEFWGYQCGMGDFLTHDCADTLGYISEFLTIFVAPMFMLCMGFNMVLTRKNSAKDFLLRGIFLLVIEITLNLLRYYIPGGFGILIAGKNGATATVLDYMLYGMLNSDIYAFAGLTFLLFALFKKCKFSYIAIMITSIITLVIGEVIAVKFSPAISEALDPNVSNLLGNFLYIDENSTFPLLQWLIFPAFGYTFGSVVTKAKNENKVFHYFAIGAVCVLAICIGVLALTKQDIYLRINAASNNNYMDAICAFAELSIAFLFIYLIRMAYKGLKLDKKEKFNATMKRISSGILYYYCIQWIIIGSVLFITGAFNVWGSQKLGIGWTLLCFVVISAISLVLTFLTQKLVAKLRAKHEQKQEQQKTN